MQTYYGKPVVMGRFTLTTLWESAGVLFYNPRCQIVNNDTGAVVDHRPFFQLRKALDTLVALSLEKPLEVELSVMKHP